MTHWDEIIAMVEGKPDTLALIIESIEGGVLPLAKLLLPEPTSPQLSLLTDAIEDIHQRLVGLNMMLIREDVQ